VLSVESRWNQLKLRLLNTRGTGAHFTGYATTQELHLKCPFMASMFSIGRHVRRHVLRQEFTE